jgi:hypothetical protein
MKLTTKTHLLLEFTVLTARPDRPVVLFNQILEKYVLAYADKSALGVVNRLPPCIQLENLCRCAALRGQPRNRLALGRGNVSSCFSQI